MKLLRLWMALAGLAAMSAQAQVVDTADTDLIDYSQFGDATEVKRFATQKVLNQAPTKLISLGFEYQGSSALDVAREPGAFNRFYTVKQAMGPRLQANFPVVSNDKWILNLGGQYWGTRYNIRSNSDIHGLEQPVLALQEYMQHSAGLSATVFKPLNEKHFLLAQVLADYNSIFPPGAGFNSTAITYSASAIYGWKTSDRKMWGLGVSRTYRLGRLIHVPVLMWNQTFNEKWGMEVLLPARAFVRRNFSPRSILLAGFELEGNQYLMPGAGSNGANLYLQRGEIKPRLQWEQQLKHFIWLSAQAGVRVNGRFDFTDRYYGADEHIVYRTQLGTPFYFNLSLNLVSP
jgi:hypothetical protein